jgi:hypothetical protein
VCTNTLALPIDETDDTILSIIEGEVLGTRLINELLVLVDAAPDESVWLTAERDRLQTEVDRLVQSIAAGVPAETVAPLVQKKRTELINLEKRLRIPRVPRLAHERLRVALEQRAEEWKSDLRAEPRIARMVLRRVIGPITLFEPAPDWCQWEAAPKADLLDGLATLQGTSPTGNQRSFNLPEIRRSEREAA